MRGVVAKVEVAEVVEMAVALAAEDREGVVVGTATVVAARERAAGTVVDKAVVVWVGEEERMVEEKELDWAAKAESTAEAIVVVVRVEA